MKDPLSLYIKLQGLEDLVKQYFLQRLRKSLKKILEKKKDGTCLEYLQEEIC